MAEVSDADVQPLGEYPELPPFGLINSVLKPVIDAVAAICGVSPASLMDKPLFSIKDSADWRAWGRGLN